MRKSFLERLRNEILVGDGAMGTMLYAKGMRAVGHGVGLDVVEWPNLDKESKFPLEPGMVLGVKFDLHGFDFGGIRQEVEVLVEENSCRSLNDII